MKNILHISLFVFYLLFSTGIHQTIQYCGDEVVSVELSTPADSQERSFDCCGNECESSCCKTEIVTIKINDFHQSEAKWNLISYQPEVNISFDDMIYASPDCKYQTADFEIYYSPPHSPAYIFNCSYLI